MRKSLHVPCAWTALILFIVSHTGSVTQIAYATKMHYIHWNTSNPIFRIDNTDHIIDVNKGNVPFEYDQVNIICPVYTNSTRDDDAEKYIIYNVSKEEYDTCRITNPSPRVVAVCDKPHKLMYFTITFRSFTPQPGGFEFKPGQDYYFISTSRRNDILSRVGGHCSNHNMKVVFKVCCRPDPPSQPPRDEGHRPRHNDFPENRLSAATTAVSTAKFVSTTASAPATSRRPFLTTPRYTKHRKPFRPELAPRDPPPRITVPKIAAGTKKEEIAEGDKAVKNGLTRNQPTSAHCVRLRPVVWALVPLVFPLLL